MLRLEWTRRFAPDINALDLRRQHRRGYVKNDLSQFIEGNGLPPVSMQHRGARIEDFLGSILLLCDFLQYLFSRSNRTEFTIQTD